jgi:phosphoribosylformimino-5-aminoimidazole carboxamide ribotide isomerase
VDILPAIDLHEGKCVRLLQGDYTRPIQYSADAVTVAREFERSGASWAHVVDLDGAREGRPQNIETVARITSETGLRLEVGGGIRDEETVRAALEAGASRVVVGTRALEDWAWFESLVHADEFRGRVCLALDAREGRLALRGWTWQTDRLAVDVAERVAAWPLAAIVYTDIGRDGMLLGPNLDAIRTLTDLSNTPVIAAGGVTDIEDVKRLALMPLLGIVIGRALYEKTLDLAEAIRIAEAED